MSGLDGTTGWTSASNATSVALSGLTTTNANDIIIVCSLSQGADAEISSISDTAGLTWQRRKTYIPQSTDFVETWWAAAPAALSSDAITINYSAEFSFAQAMAFAVSGVFSPSSPFDTNSSLPATAAGSGASGEPVVSTNGLSTFVFGLFNNFSSGAVTGPGTGFTTISGANGNQDFAEYVVKSSPVTNLTITYAGSATIIGAIGDAIALTGQVPYSPAMAFQPVQAQ